MAKICIDAGHYGKYNRCPNNPKYYESEVMWKLHNLLKTYLTKLGVTVITTRASQSKDLDLQSRGKKSKGCDLFISLHSNAVGSKMNENVDYVSVFHLQADTTTKIDEKSKEIGLLVAPVIAKVMNTKQGYKVQSRKAQTDRNKDGILNDNYYGVLHGARLVGTPALIIEHSFHTNSKMVNWLLKDSNLDKLARAEAECLASWVLKKTVKLPSVSEATKTFKVKVLVDTLYIRKGAGTKYEVVGSIKDKGTYTIVKTSGSWGKLISGAGWIYMSSKNVKKV